MIAAPTLIPIAAGFIHMLFTLGIYWAGPIVGIKTYLIALLLVEFLTGLVLNYLSNNSKPRPIILAAGAGGLIGFLPPILATYGLALGAAPVFFLYLGALYLGINFSRRNMAKRPNAD